MSISPVRAVGDDNPQHSCSPKSNIHIFVDTSVINSLDVVCICGMLIMLYLFVSACENIYQVYPPTHPPVHPSHLQTSEPRSKCHQDKSWLDQPPHGRLQSKEKKEAKPPPPPSRRPKYASQPAQCQSKCSPPSHRPVDDGVNVSRKVNRPPPPPPPWYATMLHAISCCFL